MPEDLQDEWPVWRLVLRRKATLQEMDTHWCLDDLIKANRALDLEEEVERKAHDEAIKKPEK